MDYKTKEVLIERQCLTEHAERATSSIIFLKKMALLLIRVGPQSVHMWTFISFTVDNDRIIESMYNAGQMIDSHLKSHTEEPDSIFET